MKMSLSESLAWMYLGADKYLCKAGGWNVRPKYLTTYLPISRFHKVQYVQQKIKETKIKNKKKIKNHNKIVKSQKT